MERWIAVRNFEDYEVSNYGNIRNRNSGVILKPHHNKQTGYDTIRLWKNGRHYSKNVHRLVAEAFLICDYSGLEVNHIDGDKTNNDVNNLEWCSHSENTQHAIRTGLFTPYKLPPYSPKGCRVRIVETGDVFDSLGECAAYVGGFRTAICACLNGRAKTHKGYHYELVD